MLAQESTGGRSAPLPVLVVDDDYYAREAMRVLLSRDARTRVWGMSASVDEANHALSHPGVGPLPEVVLQDMHLDGNPRAGIEAIASIRALAPKTKILVMSMDASEDAVVDAILAGADGYVWKNESADGIVNAVVDTAAGKFVVTRSIAERLLGSAVDLHGYVTEILPESHPNRELTQAISDTLHLYCVSGMSAAEIARELQVSVNTVYSRIKTAYQFLDATSREDAFRRLVERPRATNSSTQAI